MECAEMYALLVLFLLFSFSITFFVVMNICNLISKSSIDTAEKVSFPDDKIKEDKRDINTAEEENALSQATEADMEKLREIAQLRSQMEPEYYFKEDYYKLIPQFNETLLYDIEPFGQYVSLELRCLNYDANKEKLKNEIRKIIVQIAEEDASNLLSSDTTFVKPQTRNLIAK